MISVIDYGVGNIASIVNILMKLGVVSVRATKPSDIAVSSKVILPGVGAFDNAMSKLEHAGWIPILNNHMLEGKTILGICLGMQILFKSSEEGKLPGLGWFDGYVKKFSLKGNGMKIPHMGWNIVKHKKKSSLFESNGLEKRFYFVHSYHVVCNNEEDVAATCNYGFDFTCAVEKGNIFGVQFHPEKSHRFGMELMKKFIDL